MNIEEHIMSELHALATPTTMVDIPNGEVEKAILARAMSKKFRKLKADEPAIETAKKAISIAVKNNEPVRLMLFFGGNKLWNLDEAPEIDWGELFATLYYANWAKYIAEVYAPGATIEYFSMDIAVDRLNNVLPEETQHYTGGMLELFDWIGNYLPRGVHLKYTRMGDLYSSVEEFNHDMDEGAKKWQEANKREYPEMTEAKKIATALNVRLVAGQEEDDLWMEKSELQHRAVFMTKIGSKYMFDESVIPHCPTLYSGFIATGSTKKSLAKFWVGVGALEKKLSGGFNDIILPPKQLESKNYNWVNVKIEGLKGKNFNRIRVLQ